MLWRNFLESEKFVNEIMFQLKMIRRTLTLSTLASLLMATTCVAQTHPRTRFETTTELAFAPGGQTLWSEERAGKLVIRSGDGQTEIYRGSLPRGDGGELRVLKDGSLLRATQLGALQWFEPPKMGQSLRLRRELSAPPAMDWELDGTKPTTAQTAPHGARIYECQFGGQRKMELGDLRSAGVLAVAPDEKRVAVSFTIRLQRDGLNSLDSGSPKQEIIRVWNLQNGAVETEQKVLLPGWSNDKTEAGEFPFYPARLGWASNQTFVVARGLSLARFDAATGKQTGEWQPANAQREFVIADLKRLRKRQSISSVEVNEFIKSAQPRPFDVESQQLMALSDDGTQLVLFDYAESLLTLWDSATGVAQILSDEARIRPLGVRFSSDGTKVAAWNNWNVSSWSHENRSSPFYPLITQTTTAEIKTGLTQSVALTGDRIALGSNSTTPFVLRFVPSVDFGRRPARLERLRGVE